MAGARYDAWKQSKAPDEDLICGVIEYFGAEARPTGGRGQSHDLEVIRGVHHIPAGFYEVKRLHVKDGKYVDRRFKAGQRGERIYGRRDAEIKSFATALERFLDDCDWGYEAVSALHEFLDQAFARKHGKKFHEKLIRYAGSAVDIPSLSATAKAVLDGSVGAKEIEAGFASLGGIFVIADHIYTLVKPKEYKAFIGFDSGSAEGPKLAYQGVVPLDKFAR